MLKILKYNFWRTSTLLLVALLSCAKEEPTNNMVGNSARITFRVRVPAEKEIDYATRSLQSDFDAIENLNFLFYDGENLEPEASHYFSTPSLNDTYIFDGSLGMRFVYVVANAGFDMADSVPTLTALKNWSFRASASGKPGKQMFGWASPHADGSEGQISITAFTDVDVSMKRLTAMVTVAFDRNDALLPLDNQVTITPVRIELKNVPSRMTLGENKIVSAAGSIMAGDFVADNTGSQIDFANHSTANPALFLYENRQPNGTYIVDETTKTPQGFSTYNIDTNRTCSYLEVTANYSDNTPGDVKTGTIKYRFFLGKNVTDNFDVERNHHYKVTLVLRGKARSEATWRVEKVLRGEVTSGEVLLGYKSGLTSTVPVRIGDETSVPVSYTWSVTNISSGGFLRVNTLSGSTSSTAFSIPVETISEFTGITGMRTATFILNVSGPNGNFAPRTVTVRQYPRVINPIAVYGAYNNLTPREIVLKRTTSAAYPLSFSSLVSEGEWKVDVLEGAAFIKLGSTSANTTLNGVVSGTNGEIRFYYAPATATASATTNRYGKIRITYNARQLEHIIYIRQGYGDVQMYSGGANWSSFNALGNTLPTNQTPLTTFTTDFPTYTGWFFKWGNNAGMHPYTPGFKVTSTTNLETTETVNGNPKANRITGWANITKNNYNWNGTLSNTLPQRGPCPVGYRLPTINEFTVLNANSLIVGYVYDDSSPANVNSTNVLGHGSVGALYASVEIPGVNLFFPFGRDGFGMRNSAYSGALDFSDYRPADNGGVLGRLGAWYWMRNNSTGTTASTAAAHIEFSLDKTSPLVVPVTITSGTTNVFENSAKYVRCIRE